MSSFLRDNGHASFSGMMHSIPVAVYCAQCGARTQLHIGATPICEPCELKAIEVHTQRLQEELREQIGRRMKRAS